MPTITRLSNAVKKSLARRVEAYQQQLYDPPGHAQLDYLIEERGLTPDTIAKFRLGCVADPVESDEPARGRIAIPYLTPTGPVSLRFRKMPEDPHPAKYWQPAGSTLTLFNTPVITEPRDWICITEGEIDCMTAVQAGLPAVGLPGVSSWQDHYYAIFNGYERVLILADNDDKAGQGAKFADQVAKKVPGPAVFLMPDGHDVNSFYKAHGAQALKDLLKIKH
ncbi:toprim domain-containing protein [Arthrobacter sp. 18067]|uniref:toprim domain-containing protein n=1 Tax=Arthrobacter sp. 18067 TaxID=2681413 RepID=UPI001F17682D|nr:toprim domain-containing protein [Arthrobacter sp. 18067]